MKFNQNNYVIKESKKLKPILETYEKVKRIEIGFSLAFVDIT